VSSQVARLVASSFGLVAFALATVVGLSVGNPADAILSRALVALILGGIAGYAVGLICQHLVAVTSARIESAAEATLEEEEAALQHLLHPDHQDESVESGQKAGANSAGTSGSGRVAPSGERKPKSARTPSTPQQMVVEATAGTSR
jgi:hypothetical protein